MTMSEPVLGGILRKFLKSDDTHWDISGEDLTLDGHVKIDVDEVRVIGEVMTPHE